MATGTNFIDLEYRAKNLKTTIKSTEDLNEKTKILVDFVKDCREAFNEMGNSSGKAVENLSQILTKGMGTAQRQLRQLGSDAAKVMLQVSKDAEKMQTKMSSKDAVKNLTKDLERLRDQWQANERQIAKSQNELLKGKKNTPIESSYLIQQQKMLQKEIDKTINKLETYKRSYNGATSDINKAIKHDSDSQAYTEANIKQREARDLLNQTQSLYNQQLEKVRELTKAYGENNEATKIAKQHLQETEAIREQAKTTLQETHQELVEQGKLEESIGEDVLNRVAVEEKLAENKRIEKTATEAQKEAERELTLLIQQRYQIEDKITKLSTNKKGQISEVSKNQHKYEIQALEREKNAINNHIKAIEKKYTLEGKVTEKIENSAQAESNARRITEAHNKDLQNQGKLLSETIKNFAKFTLYYQSLRLLKQGINEALDTMKDLDKAMTDVRLVTGTSIEDTNKLAQEYNQLAKEMGATTTAVAEGAGEWLRQGKSAEETSKLLKASMTLSKVGAIESSEATQLLTSSLNGYKYSAEEAMTVVDKISAIDLAAATSSQELAVALSRTANIADDSSISFNKLLAMIGTVSSVTRRSAETIRRII